MRRQGPALSGRKKHGFPTATARMPPLCEPGAPPAVTAVCGSACTAIESALLAFDALEDSWFRFSDGEECCSMARCSALGCLTEAPLELVAACEGFEQKARDPPICAPPI